MIELGEKREYLGIIFVVISAAGFSTLGIFSKLCYQEGLPIPTILSFRFLLATAIVWPVLYLSKNLDFLRGRNLFKAFGLGAFGYAAMSGFFLLAVKFVSAGVASIFLYTYPVFVVCIALLLLKETITKWILLALILILTGIIVIDRVNPVGRDLRGIGLALSASIVYSVYITISRETLFTIDTRVLTAHVLPSAAVSFLVIGFFTHSLTFPQTMASWLLLLGLAIITTVIPIMTFFAGLSRIGASRASLISTLEPVFTVIQGILILNERFTLATGMGGALILLGVIIVEIEHSNLQPEKNEEPEEGTP